MFGVCYDRLALDWFHHYFVSLFFSCLQFVFELNKTSNIAVVNQSNLAPWLSCLSQRLWNLVNSNSSYPFQHGFHSAQIKMCKYETWTAALLLQFLLPTHTLRWTWQHLGWQGKRTPSHALPRTQSLRLKLGFIKVSHPFRATKCERDGQSDRSTTICNIVFFQVLDSSKNSGISISRNPGCINIKEEKIKCSEKFN